MPINHAIWTVNANPQPLPITRLPSETFLEDMIINRPEILSGEWMLIGRQEHTGFGGRIDLLAIAPDASLVQILKRDRTPARVPSAGARVRHVGRRADRKAQCPALPAPPRSAGIEGAGHCCCSARSAEKTLAELALGNFSSGLMRRKRASPTMGLTSWRH